MSFLFTASSIMVNISSGTDYGSPDASGNNPTFNLKKFANYDFIIADGTFSTAIRNGITDSSEVVGAFNNDPVNGKTNTTIMWTPTAAGTYYYVNVDNTSKNGQIIIS